MEQPITLSDLPTIVVDGIIVKIHRRISYDVYLCDLRLVNRQFNEAILHFLAFKRDPRPYTPSHYRSCRRNWTGWRDDPRTKCAFLECRHHGICNPTYTRIHLQAGIASERDLKSPFLEFYRTLREALTRLRNDLAKLDSNLTVLRSQLNNTTSFPFVSHNAVFCDKISVALCDATLLVRDLRINNRYRPPWDKNFTRQRRVCFWLRNLACYLGDLEMLHFYTSEACDNKTSDQIRAKENRELLGMAAARGHENMVRFLLPSWELRRCDVYLAIRGVFYSGSASITETILSKMRYEELGQVCSQPLLKWRDSVRPSRNYPAVAAILDEYYERHWKRLSPPVSPEMENSNITSPAGRNLLQHSQGVTTFLWPPDRHASLRDILRYACHNRDVVCFRAILEEAGVESIQTPEKFLTVSTTDYPICSNSLSILQEICRFTGRDIHTHYLSSIACLEGSTDIMAKQLELDPSHFCHPTDVTTDFPGASTVRSATVQLRVENVKFLLQRGARTKYSTYISWRYRRLHEEQFQAIQNLLRQYDCPEMEVSI